MNEYEKQTYLQWDDKFVGRHVNICAKCSCENLVRIKSTWSCNLIEEINKDVENRIKDWENAKSNCDFACKFKKHKLKKGRRYALDAFLRNAENIYYSEDDYFPTHKVPRGCKYLLEHTIV